MNHPLENIRWRTFCPWLLLVDCLRLAFRVRVLLLAFVAIVLMLMVTSHFERAIPGPNAVDILYGNWWSPLNPGPIRNLSDDAFAGLMLPWMFPSVPIINMLDGPRSFGEAAAIVFVVFWQLAVWAALGGAICRIAALALTRGEAPDLPNALRYAKRNYGAFFSAPLMTFAAVLFVSLPLVILGLLMRLDWLSYVAAFFWPLALLIGLGVALLTIGLAVGFPLMSAAVAVEETDAFDAISRAFSYVYQRPLRLLWYVLVAAFLGWLGGMAVEFVLNATRSTTTGAVRWGHGSAEIPLRADKIIAFWTDGLYVLRWAYYYAYFWSAAVGIYLLMRRDIDSVQLDEVAIEPMETYQPSPLVAAGAAAESQPASN